MIYLIGSLRNPKVPLVAAQLRAYGHDVFDEWYAPGPETDEFWQSYEKARGRKFTEALYAPHATEVFRIDKKYLDKADAAVMVLPCGRSGHLELGYVIGTGKPGYILLEGEPERYDVMYRFATKVVTSLHDLIGELSNGHST